MGRAALQSVGENPKPTGTFRPGAEGTKKSCNFTQTTATLESLRKEGTKSTHCTVQCWILGGYRVN